MGKIILIGGNVDKGTHLAPKEEKALGQIKNIKMVKLEILQRIMDELKGTDSRLEIVTSASAIPFAIGNEYKKAFQKLTCKKVRILHIRNSKDANLKKNLDRLAKCDGILFTGGNQSLLCRILHKTQFLHLLRERYKNEKNFLVSGTSAGAMALAKVMIAAEKTPTAFVKGHINITEGLGLLTRIIVDTHFIQRRRLSRLIEAVATYPAKLGIGLSEDTAVFFETPQKVEVIGNNIVVLIDGSHISYNNIKQIKKNQSVCLVDVKLHVLPKGHKFNIVTKKILLPHAKNQ